MVDAALARRSDAVSLPSRKSSHPERHGDERKSPPAQQPVFQRRHAPGDAHADQREQNDYAKHAIGLEARGEDLQGLAEAVLRGDDLTADDAEQREDKPE